MQKRISFSSQNRRKRKRPLELGSEGSCESGQEQKSIPSSGNSRSKDLKVEKLLGCLEDVRFILLQEPVGSWGEGESEQ